MKRFLAAFARNTVFANILLAGFLFAGVLASGLMVREMFPEFAIEMVTVSVAYPGADPEEVEEGISRKIEEAIDGLEGIKRYTTQSHEGVGAAVIEIVEGYDMRKAKDEIKTRIDAINTFPVDAEKPIVNEVTLTREVLVVALSGPLDERGLKEWAERVKDQLRALPGISQVEVAGAREYEIAIEVSEDRLREYGLTFQQVANAVRTSNLNMAGGTLRTRGEHIRLRTIGRKYWGEEFKDIIVLAHPRGDIVRLGDIAEVKDSFTEDGVASQLNGEPTVLLMVSKTSEEDAIAISEAVHAWVARQQEQLPAGAKIGVWSDSSDMIRARINLLLKNGAYGLILVFLLLWMFLDLRLSFWAAMGIPISLAGGLGVLWMVGGTINMMSLFGLIMVLGIVVDDAIVVGEAIYVHRKNGDPPLAAAVNGVLEVGMPVVAAVTTTVVAFLPLMFVSGIMGKFIAILPIAVISALLVSLVECLVMLPAHLSHLPDPDDPRALEKQRRNPFRRARRAVSDGMEWFVGHMYTPFLGGALQWRYLVLCIGIAVFMFAVSLQAGGFVKFVMFPPIDGNSVTARVEFPNGTPEDVTREAVRRIEAGMERVAAETATISGAPLIKNRYSLVGGTLGGQVGSGAAQGNATHLGAVRVEMLESEHRGIHSRDIIAQWEKAVGVIPGAVALTIGGEEMGPPGKPIEMWVQGEEMGPILAAVDELKAKLAEFEGVSQVESDFRPGKNEIRFELKPEGHALGLTVSDLARQVFAGFFGEEALRIQRGRDDIRVRVRYTLEERSHLAELGKVRVRTPQGHEVPLESVARASYGPGYAGITRTDGMRRVAVSADVDFKRANGEEILASLEEGFLPQLEARYPGVTIAQQGNRRDTQESLGSLMVGFPLALVGIFIIVATIFRSYIQPLIIMVTVPFGIVGVVFGHFLLGMPLSMMSMFGVVALSGVVVNDAIVLIECINNLIAQGLPFIEAVKRGGARRFRAIFLTTVTTVGGLAPMLMEQDLQARFLQPMALSIAAGVAFATLLTLVFIPCLLAVLNDARRLLRYLATGAWVDPEDVEPARNRNADLDEMGLGAEA